MLKQTCNNLYIAKKQEETDEKVGLFLGENGSGFRIQVICEYKKRRRIIVCYAPF